jgi:DNA-binding transcriptional ArsR family regulator
MAATGRQKRTSERPLQQLAELFQQLSYPLRLTILAALAEHGERAVTDLSKLVRGERADVSHHLQLMRLAGLVQCRRAGRYILYRTGSAGLAVLVERCFTVAANGPTLEARGFSLTFKRRPA